MSNTTEAKHWSETLTGDQNWDDYKVEEIEKILRTDAEEHGVGFSDDNDFLLTIEPLGREPSSLTFPSLADAVYWVGEETYHRGSADDETLYSVRDKSLTEVHTQYGRG